MNNPDFLAVLDKVKNLQLESIYDSPESRTLNVSKYYDELTLLWHTELTELVKIVYGQVNQAIDEEIAVNDCELKLYYAIDCLESSHINLQCIKRLQLLMEGELDFIQSRLNSIDNDLKMAEDEFYNVNCMEWSKLNASVCYLMEQSEILLKLSVKLEECLDSYNNVKSPTRLKPLMENMILYIEQLKESVFSYNTALQDRREPIKNKFGFKYILNPVKPIRPPSEENVVEPTGENFAQPTEENAVQPTEANVVQPTEANVVQPIEANTVQPPEANTVQPPEANVVQPPEANTVQPTEANVVQPPEANIVQPTEANVIQPPEENVVQPPKENVVQPPKENVIQPKEDQSIIGGTDGKSDNFGIAPLNLSNKPISVFSQTKSSLGENNSNVSSSSSSNVRGSVRKSNPYSRANKSNTKVKEESDPLFPGIGQKLGSAAPPLSEPTTSQTIPFSFQSVSTQESNPSLIGSTPEEGTAKELNVAKPFLFDPTPLVKNEPDPTSDDVANQSSSSTQPPTTTQP